MRGIAVYSDGRWSAIADCENARCWLVQDVTPAGRDYLRVFCWSDKVDGVAVYVEDHASLPLPKPTQHSFSFRGGTW